MNVSEEIKQIEQQRDELGRQSSKLHERLLELRKYEYKERFDESIKNALLPLVGASPGDVIALSGFPDNSYDTEIVTFTLVAPTTFGWVIVQPRNTWQIEVLTFLDHMMQVCNISVSGLSSMPNATHLKHCWIPEHMRPEFDPKHFWERFGRVVPEEHRHELFDYEEMKWK